MNCSTSRDRGARDRRRSQRRPSSFVSAIYCAFALFFTSSSLFAAIPTTERTALINLFNSTNGAGWRQQNWTTAPGVFAAAGSECTWYGVTCDAGKTTVQVIYLESNNLVGSLSDLSALPNLQAFIVSSNQLTGPIPSLNTLHNLQDFEARYNNLKGTVPSLSGMTNLQILRLGSNSLSGAIPSLSGLSNLQYLSLYQNQLTGTIPTLTDLTSLIYLDVGYNQLTGTIPALPKSTALTGMSLTNNNFTGSLPDISGYASVVAFYASNNQFTGTLPSLSKLTQLQDFEVDHNKLTGAVPSLSAQTQLQYFDIGYNQLSGPLPPAPSSLYPQESVLCPNALTPTPDLGWDWATGFTPWYSPCTNPTHIITTTLSPHGTISPSGPVTIADGATMAFIVSPESGYSSKIGGTCGQPAFPPNYSYRYSTGRVTADCTVEVQFLPSTTFSVTANPSSAVFGQAVTLTATIGGGSAPATGTVSFIDGYNTSSPPLATINVVNGKAVFTTSALSPGSHNFTCTYSGDDTHTSTLVQGVLASPIGIDPGATVTTLQAPATAPYFEQGIQPGGQLTVTATVVPVAPSAGKPTGSIVFSDGVDSCTVTLPQATCKMLLHTKGARSVTAAYKGDNNFSASTSSVASVFVTPPTSFTLTDSVTFPVIGQDIVFTVNFNDATINAMVPLNASDSQVGPSQQLGLIPVVAGQGSLTLNFGHFQAYYLEADYAGDSTHTPAAAKELLALSPASTTTVVTTPPAVVVNTYTNIYAHVEVNAPGKGTPTGTIQIRLQSGDGCDIDLPATFCTLFATVAQADTLTATYTGVWDFRASSASIPLIVQASKPATLYPTQVSMTSTINPSFAYQATSLVATVTGDNSVTGAVVFKDGQNLICTGYVKAIGNQFKAYCPATFATSSLSSISASYSGDALHSASSVSGYTQNVIATLPAFNANQFGITGSWYNPATSGQGLEIVALPDHIAPGKGVLFAGWFTYIVGNQSLQDWYTLQGEIDANQAISHLDIFQTIGGNFNAPPKVSATKVGSADLVFSDCNHATLSYSFPAGNERTGLIPLSRLSASLACASTGDQAGAPADTFLSGAWYDPNTSGQGILIDVSPSQSTLFGAWYTFAATSPTPYSSQRWFTIQTNDYVSGSRTANAKIYVASGGSFNDVDQVITQEVGDATIKFDSCNQMTLTYLFSSGELAGSAGSIEMTPVAGAPAACK